MACSLCIGLCITNRDLPRLVVCISHIEAYDRGLPQLVACVLHIEAYYGL